MSLDLTVLIITLNESRHIERAIESVSKIAREIIVVDSYSTDKTVELATRAGARVMQNEFVSHSKQFQWGLDHGGIATTWIMRLDADEVIEPDLAAKLSRDLPDLPSDIAGINLDRKHVFMGRWVRHGGRYPVRLMRVWRTKQGRVENRWMDEHILVWGGRTVTFKGGFADVNLADLTAFTDKHNKYATREAIDRLSKRYNLFALDKDLSSISVSRQASVKRWFKENMYNRLPFWVGPLLYFFYRYIIQLGFLDGRSGLIYHFLQGFWYRFLVGAKVFELEEAIAGCQSNDERITRLQQLTGLTLEQA